MLQLFHISFSFQLVSFSGYIVSIQFQLGKVAGFKIACKSTSFNSFSIFKFKKYNGKLRFNVAASISDETRIVFDTYAASVDPIS